MTFLSLSFGVWAVLLCGGLLALLVAVAGWRKTAFGLFAIRPSRMTVGRLGLEVTETEDVDRVNNVLGAFARGFNAMITKSDLCGVEASCRLQPSLYRPFAEEGVAMGYTLRQLFRFDSSSFEETVVKARPEFRYLYYVGLGFWSGMQKHSTERLMRLTYGLDPLHRYLCFDGYGFKFAFFDAPKDRAALHRLDKLPGYARNAAYQGVGRALYFRYLANPSELIKQVRKLGPYAKDAAAGIGLASVFVNPDRISKAQELAEAMPDEWRNDFHLGMCFAMKARSINDVDQFQQYMSDVDSDVSLAAFASIRECDRVELQVRADGQEDKYLRWREQVTTWLDREIQYPMAGVVKKIDAASLSLSARTS